MRAWLLQGDGGYDTVVVCVVMHRGSMGEEERRWKLAGGAGLLAHKGRSRLRGFARWVCCGLLLAV